MSSFPIAAQPHCCAIQPTHLAEPHHPPPDDALEKKDDNRVSAVLVCGMILSRAVVRLASFLHRSAPAARRLPSPSFSRVPRSPKRGSRGPPLPSAAHDGPAPGTRRAGRPFPLDSVFEVSRPPTKQLLRDMRGAETVLPAGVIHYRGSQGEDVRALAAALETNTTVTSLSLGGTKVGAEGAARLAAALEKNSTMTSLDISRNDIGPK